MMGKVALRSEHNLLLKSQSTSQQGQFMDLIAFMWQFSVEFLHLCCIPSRLDMAQIVPTRIRRVLDTYRPEPPFLIRQNTRIRIAYYVSAYHVSGNYG